MCVSIKGATFLQQLNKTIIRIQPNPVSGLCVLFMKQSGGGVNFMYILESSMHLLTLKIVVYTLLNYFFNTNMKITQRYVEYNISLRIALDSSNLQLSR